MELIKIVNARQTIDSLSDRENIGAHLSYWMTKFVAQTKNEHEFYAKEMQKLFDTYGVKSEDDRIVIPTERVAQFQDAVIALEHTDVATPSIRFNLSELASELKLSMKQMYPLLDFIDEDK